jgi:hypothetical protein
MSILLQKDCRDLLQGLNNILSFMVEWLEIGDFLHLLTTSSIFMGDLIHLKIDPKDKTKWSKVVRKIMYNNFQKKKFHKFEALFFEFSRVCMDSYLHMWDPLTFSPTHGSFNPSWILVPMPKMFNLYMDFHPHAWNLGGG